MSFNDKFVTFVTIVSLLSIDAQKRTAGAIVPGCPRGLSRMDSAATTFSNRNPKAKGWGAMQELDPFKRLGYSIHGVCWISAK